ncbi:MAG: endopeptidase La [Gammaproteobacteria bacterium]|nr:MAG: endopeptidase La [Gammaproteobacteria bacterium]UTW41702.1 endopeptidase La [bacterium SCSIO 12844]
MSQEVERVTEQQVSAYPVLALRDVVVYPNMVVPLFIGREKSVRAIEKAMATNQKIVLVAQKEANDKDPLPDYLFELGTMASILQLLKLPDGTLKVLVEGEKRARISRYATDFAYLSAEIELIEDNEPPEDVTEPITRTLVTEFDQYVKLNKKIPPEVINSVSSTRQLGRLVDTIAAHMSLKIEDRQALLEALDVCKRAEKLMVLMETEMDILQVERTIMKRVKQQMERNQREYYLNEQMKAIQKELGEMEDGQNELDDIESRIKEAKMSQEAEKKGMQELKKLRMMSPASSEATVSRNYIDTLINVPWSKRSRVKKDLTKAEEVLNVDHYGLEKVKERILEYLAVQQRKRKLKGPILCLVGPPGVGKTSLGQSIARATGRHYVRMALGGVRDEAEIRGHRRTYIGSLPGQIIQKMTKAGTRNPLFLLDEIDKMSMDFRGDPASAMLEVLDPEQNHAFNDHYLEVDYDLSDVMFVATANSLNIPEPLLDRMEVIRLSGYTEDEKLNIANRYLVPKQIEATGLKKGEIEISDKIITDVIRYYTREAGVRELERYIATLCRKSVKSLLLDKKLKHIKITSEILEDYLGVKKYRYGIADEKPLIGQVTGLAWTRVGGELLKIEAVATPGKGKVVSTGKLGDVMQESIQAAVTVVRSLADKLNLKDDFYEKYDLHVHLPEGATPKDGPSAGIAMCTSLVSVLADEPVRADVAMTGEITLRGEVLPIGGLKEKLLAALRGGIKTVLIPEENKRELVEMPDNIKDGLEIIPVQWVNEVLTHALVNGKKLLNKSKKSSPSAKKTQKTKNSEKKS